MLDDVIAMDENAAFYFWNLPDWVFASVVYQRESIRSPEDLYRVGDALMEGFSISR